MTATRCTTTKRPARASRFGEIVVQGGVTSAILNAVVAEELPGPGTVFLNVNWAFMAPVRPGDTITGRSRSPRCATTSRSPSLQTPSPAMTERSSLEGTAVCYTMDITIR